MRALYPLRYYPTLTETFVQDELRGMVEAGHAVSVASLGARADGHLARPVPGVPVHTVSRGRLDRLRGPQTAAARQVARWQRPKDAARLPALARLARQVDLLHVHFAGEAAELAWAVRQDCGVPYCVMVHAVDLFKPRPSLDRVLSDAAAVLTVAEHHQGVLADRGHSAQVVRCGPRLADFAALPPPPGGPLRALFVGRDVPKKGLDRLLAVWPRTPESATLTVISDRATGPWPDRVRAPGLQPRAAVRAALATCNVVVLPCERAADGDQDGVPVVLMEALAARRPVVTTALSGIPELVDAEVGWLTPPGDEDALLDAICAAADPAERARRGAAGPARLAARGFSAARQVTVVANVWRSRCEDVACGSPPPRS